MRKTILFVVALYLAAHVASSYMIAPWEIAKEDAMWDGTFAPACVGPHPVNNKQ